MLLISILMNSSLAFGQRVKKEKEIVLDGRVKDQVSIRKHYLQLEDHEKVKKIFLIKQEFKIKLAKLLADSSEVFQKKREKIEKLIDMKNLEVSNVLSKEELRLFIEAEPRLAPTRINTSINRGRNYKNESL